MLSSSSFFSSLKASSAVATVSSGAWGLKNLKLLPWLPRALKPFHVTVSWAAMSCLCFMEHMLSLSPGTDFRLLTKSPTGRVDTEFITDLAVSLSSWMGRNPPGNFPKVLTSGHSIVLCLTVTILGTWSMRSTVSMDVAMFMA